jgi:hypothetical protein
MYVDRSQPAQDKVQRQELVHTIMNVNIPLTGKNLDQVKKFSFTNKNSDRIS